MPKTWTFSPTMSSVLNDDLWIMKERSMGISQMIRDYFIQTDFCFYDFSCSTDAWYWDLSLALTIHEKGGKHGHYETNIISRTDNVLG